MEAKRPRVALFENVKNLVGHDNGNTFRVICEQLELLGYHYTYQVLNAMNYGNMAQNRERIYIVAFRDSDDFNKFYWPLSVPLTTTVRDIIDFDSKMDDKYYYTEGKYKGDIYELLVEATKNDDIKNPAIYNGEESMSDRIRVVLFQHLQQIRVKVDIMYVLSKQSMDCVK